MPGSGFRNRQDDGVQSLVSTSDDLTTPDPEDSQEAASPAGDDIPNNSDGDFDLESCVLEDDPNLLDATARSLEGGAPNDDNDSAESESESDSDTETVAVADADDSSDAASVADQLDPTGESSEKSLTPDQKVQESAHKVAVELKRIETEVRKLLENRDTRRKRKFAGSHRWAELEDDILNWRYSGRMDESTLQLLQRLICRRHYLFHELSFLASTRPVWNS